MALYDDEINAERDAELEAARKTIDALVAALEEMLRHSGEHRGSAFPGACRSARAALALARGEG